MYRPHSARIAGTVLSASRHMIAKGTAAVMIGKLPAVRIGIDRCAGDLPAAIATRVDTTVLTGG